jgi:hypothetical protein
MAARGRFKVVPVDCRMAPDFPFPAALGDAMAPVCRRTDDPAGWNYIYLMVIVIFFEMSGGLKG